jgi:hypothetical protein
LIRTGSPLPLSRGHAFIGTSGSCTAHPHLPLIPAEAGNQFCPGCVKDWVRASAPVKELPHPLIPADAGIQTLPNCTDFQWARLGPRVRGDERVETLLSFGSFLHRLFRGDERGGTTSFHFTSLFPSPHQPRLPVRPQRTGVEGNAAEFERRGTPQAKRCEQIL